ncbi:hypothetical protein OAM05_00395 [Candidatus Pelagibacter sp.]|jgi:hypothetical protein|nr:hypothetical protein [Candidatus Pelagibacter sp.]|tara:strand:+ start:76 stop:723 length:648 start_codon:yes stop_codon:yes gene_type:complete
MNEEEIEIIENQTRNEKIKNFFIEYKNQIIVMITSIFLVMIAYFSYEHFRNLKRIELSNQYNLIVIDFSNNSKKGVVEKLTSVVNEKDRTYSPLALYFLIDNNLVQNKDQINNLFNSLIEKTNLDLDIKNLLIYKKALFNSDTSSENELINILSPIINSKSIWKSHALYLIAEFFYSKNEKNKAKEFFQQIISLENSNPEIRQKAVKRIKRDFSE